MNTNIIDFNYKYFVDFAGDWVLPQSSTESWIPGDNKDTADTHVHDR